MVQMLRTAICVVPAEWLWANLNCGLKTRRWEQAVPALKNRVATAKIVRETTAATPPS